MVARDDGKYVLYPIYFDAKATRPPRRVSKKAAIHGPTADAVAEAAARIGIGPVIERGKHHPSRWFKRDGRVLVDAVGSKDAIIRQIAEMLPEVKVELAARREAEQKGSKGRKGGKGARRSA